ncbi:hypothetical protein BX666DRAFT_1015586 [Dichotomocladium elegans]|nr:hypothetical protein BX666DRAFT_1015586 [Dichotomocladium elegans]
MIYLSISERHHSLFFLLLCSDMNNDYNNASSLLTTASSFLIASLAAQISGGGTAGTLEVPRTLLSHYPPLLSPSYNIAWKDWFQQTMSFPFVSSSYFYMTQPVSTSYHSVHPVLHSLLLTSTPQTLSELCPTTSSSPSASSTGSMNLYCCDRCPKEYKAKRSLTRHIKSAHKGQKFTCGICHTGLSRKDALRRHQSKSKKCNNIRKLQSQKSHGGFLPHVKSFHVVPVNFVNSLLFTASTPQHLHCSPLHVLSIHTHITERFVFLSSILHLVLQFTKLTSKFYFLYISWL